MKFTGLILFLCTIAICVMSFSFLKRSYVDIAQEIRNKIGKELAKKHQMRIAGIGGGMMDCVREIAVSFQLRRVLSQDELRCLIVDCVEEFLKAFNENQEIRPYLSNYPFTTANLDIRIFVSTPQGGDVHYPDFDIVGVYNEDFVTYKREDHEGKSLKPIVEAYQEALAKVKRDNQCLQSLSSK